LENSGKDYEVVEDIEIDLELPEADIDGLHFNETKVHAVFEKQDDGWYQSRDILFFSARDTDEGTGRDLLSEYLQSNECKAKFALAINDCDCELKVHRLPNLQIFIPEENQGIKKYNGARWWYWLRPRHSASAAGFCHVNHYGGTANGLASSVGGCAPAFCVGENRHE
jgi:hypothetical protein